MAVMFQLAGGGIGVMPDPVDNAGNHTVPHHESGTRISFGVLNVGTAGGNAKVGVEVDDTFVADWHSNFLNQGEQDTGYVQLGRLSKGQHTVLIYVNPGSSELDHDSNTFDVA